MWKLWLEKLPWIPAEDKMSCNYEVSKARVKGRLSRNRNGSVLEALMRSRKHDGDDMESTATSSSPKWIEGEKLARFGTVNSAERRKPKKAKLQAAQNIQWSGSPKHQKSPS